MKEKAIDIPLLSHHGTVEQYRCLSIPLPDGRYLVCARCAGGIAGLAVGLPLTWFCPGWVSPWILLLAFPDWIASALAGYKGGNMARVASGCVIGLVYALNIHEFALGRFNSNLWCANVSAVALYAITATAAINRKRRGTLGAKTLDHLPSVTNTTS